MNDVRIKDGVIYFSVNGREVVIQQDDTKLGLIVDIYLNDECEYTSTYWLEENDDDI